MICCLPPSLWRLRYSRNVCCLLPTPWILCSRKVSCLPTYYPRKVCRLLSTPWTLQYSRKVCCLLPTPEHYSRKISFLPATSLKTSREKPAVCLHIPSEDYSQKVCRLHPMLGHHSTCESLPSSSYVWTLQYLGKVCRLPHMPGHFITVLSKSLPSSSYAWTLYSTCEKFAVFLLCLDTTVLAKSLLSTSSLNMTCLIHLSAFRPIQYSRKVCCLLPTPQNTIRCPIVQNWIRCSAFESGLKSARHNSLEQNRCRVLAYVKYICPGVRVSVRIKLDIVLYCILIYWRLATFFSLQHSRTVNDAAIYFYYNVHFVIITW
jgi:hypothetical protein